jgi:hypothetical protein
MASSFSKPVHTEAVFYTSQIEERAALPVDIHGVAAPSLGGARVLPVSVERAYGSGGDSAKHKVPTVVNDGGDHGELLHLVPDIEASGPPGAGKEVLPQNVDRKQEVIEQVKAAAGETESTPETSPAAPEKTTDTGDASSA